MSEKTDIEKATAQAFILLYNDEMETDYQITAYADAPDVRCSDSQGKALNLEITLTEDRLGDIQARLGRSDARSLMALKAHLAKVRAGKADVLERVGSLADNVSEISAQRIQAKLNKNYGPNIALVVRDTSGLDWDWSLAVEVIRTRLKLGQNPFDKGIWILSFAKDRIFRVV